MCILCNSPSVISQSNLEVIGCSTIQKIQLDKNIRYNLVVVQNCPNLHTILASTEVIYCKDLPKLQNLHIHNAENIVVTGKHIISNLQLSGSISTKIYISDQTMNDWDQDNKINIVTEAAEIAKSEVVEVVEVVENKPKIDNIVIEPINKKQNVVEFDPEKFYLFPLSSYSYCKGMEISSVRKITGNPNYGKESDLRLMRSIINHIAKDFKDIDVKAVTEMEYEKQLVCFDDILLRIKLDKSTAQDLPIDFTKFSEFDTEMCSILRSEILLNERSKDIFTFRVMEEIEYHSMNEPFDPYGDLYN